MKKFFKIIASLFIAIFRFFVPKIEKVEPLSKDDMLAVIKKTYEPIHEATGQAKKTAQKHKKRARRFFFRRKRIKKNKS